MIRLTSEPIEPGHWASLLHDETAGAVVTFEGRVRKISRGRNVQHLFYEAYPPMAEKELQRLVEEAHRRWELTRAVIVHRTGRLEIGECSVFIGVSAPHRDAAFQACRFLIDTLKVRVPIWKKEVFEDGSSWVEGPRPVPGVQ
ncbi:MAG: molybdenum cofactor biosynthesis protein MoaE [Acidobacteriota bacterium]